MDFVRQWQSNEVISIVFWNEQGLSWLCSWNKIQQLKVKCAVRRWPNWDVLSRITYVALLGNVCPYIAASILIHPISLWNEWDICYRVGFITDCVFFHSKWQFRNIQKFTTIFGITRVAIAKSTAPMKSLKPLGKNIWLQIIPFICSSYGACT